ncbi:pentatricopeptide repeat-containing protein At2g03880, mitochondrial [Macadamia integrifolia]|uniref:pentatricopeptide repeat-containing protein At2g03880, mitochondrial n=1 Tax=Macadamia integrifolia TaxID=60698 RepID=UPI001C4F7C82|nr:pentatricopeptide repeat-containing protein At2g03880, mitochondrial [Macadamia integrifolia]
MNKLNWRPLQFSIKICQQRNQREFIQQIHSSVNNGVPIFSIVAGNRHLDGLSKSGRVVEARHLFDEMPERDEFTWNTMIAAYARSGRLTEARQLFDETPYRSSIAWSSLISGYSRLGCGKEALELFWEMQLEGLKPNQYTLGSVLRACSIAVALRRGKQIHAYAIKTQFDTNVFVVTGLVDMYAKCKQVLEAEYLFRTMPDKNNHVLWTAMVTGYSQNGDPIKAMQCFRGMRLEGVGSNQFTFPSVLTSCAAALALGFGMQVHGCIIQSGFGANIFVESALVDMYAKCRDLNSARRVLEAMEVEDIVSWNSLIVGCVRLGLEEEALSLFKMMHLKNMKMDDFTYPSVLNSFASIMDIQNARSVHCSIVKTGFECYRHVSNALVDMYAKQGSLDWAARVFNKMPEQDVVSWTSLITGYTHHGSHEEALMLFCDMRIAGIDPDQFVIASILSACAELTVLAIGRQVHANFVRYGFQSSLSVENSLVTMYAKCGCIEDAYRVFDYMSIRDVVSWTALIVGLAKNGRGKDSLLLYENMITTGTSPDFVTFIGLLFACSHAGLVDDGCRYFQSMDMVHGIAPGPEHYACIIDLLGRSGKIDEVKELLNQMTVKPDATIWKAVLAACRIHGNLELAEGAARNLFELEPSNAVPYVLLSNIYSAAGRWDDAANVRRLMKSKGITKEPGCSWIEMNSRIHTFMAEDRSHQMMSEIYAKLNEIMISIKKAGYVPDMDCVLHDMDEEGKELGLAYHSEKLAVAFGLLGMLPGVPIRIFKNLRVCGDCHTAMKFISKVFERHIILRDPNCFHHFSEGTCSCKDYW